MKLDLDIHNFYEHLVLEYLVDNKFNEQFDHEILADISCLALSQLPARYIRHDIDMAFFLDRSERAKMTGDVAAAIDKAVTRINAKT
ncbi:MAG: late competence development ComFB family protein [Oceanospirillaceae bacterium]|nr:late competence development ComFB family protein [Oceanospirillaceae bacterium]